MTPIERAALAARTAIDHPMIADQDAEDMAWNAARAAIESIDTDDLARVLAEHWNDVHTNESLGQQRHLADVVKSHVTGESE